jgi:hypothetical protein
MYQFKKTTAPAHGMYQYKDYCACARHASISATAHQYVLRMLKITRLFPNTMYEENFGILWLLKSCCSAQVHILCAEFARTNS